MAQHPDAPTRTALPYGDVPRDDCSVAATLEVVGDRWSVLVLREAFYGVRRFNDLQRNLGIPRNVLTARLQKLVHAGVLRRVPYREAGSRERHEYRLTSAGVELLPTVVALMQWGDRHLAGDTGGPVVVRHRDCGATVSAVLACDAGHSGLTAFDTEPEVGPAARASA
ncbi:MAG: winged helix-turn-helix transcriptional regulator [Actinomycetes bacterium]